MRYIPVEEDVYEKLEKIAKSKGVKLHELVNEILSKYCKKLEKDRFRKLEEVFCEGNKSVRIKGTPISVSRGEFFVKGDVDYELLKKFVEEHDARLVEETSESGDLLGYSIVPNVGFNGKTIEEWFEENGIPLLKKLVAIF